MANNRKIVPECQQALDRMKYEIAWELGLPVGSNASQLGNVEFATELGTISASSVQNGNYWGHIASRDTGAVGGAITSRLVKQAEQTLLGLK